MKNVYWFVAGGLIGLGFIAFGLGLIPALVGAAMVLAGIKRQGSQRFWVVLIGMGTVPFILLLHTILTSDESSRLGGSSDWIMLFLFGVMILAGSVWGVIKQRSVQI